MDGTYARLEIVRMLRDPRYLALAVIAPIGFYLLFASIFGGGRAAPGEPAGPTRIMVAMAVYGAAWAAMCATAPRLSQERSNGWLEQLRALPLDMWRVVTAKIEAAFVVTLPAVVLVFATAALDKDVRLPAWQWLALLACVWVGSLPFALLGVAIGFCVGAETSFPLSYAVYMVMSAMGGLWVPPAQLPSSFRPVTDGLPTFRVADAGWRIVSGGAPALGDYLVTASWAAVLVAIAVVAYRRPRIERHRAAGPAAEQPAKAAEPAAS